MPFLAHVNQQNFLKIRIGKYEFKNKKKKSPPPPTHTHPTLFHISINHLWHLNTVRYNHTHLQPHLLEGDGLDPLGCDNIIDLKSTLAVHQEMGFSVHCVEKVKVQSTEVKYQ